MDTNFSPIENYPFLSPFIFNEDPGIIEKHKISILKRLDNVWRPLKIDACQTHEYLAARENVFATVVAEHFEKQYQIIVKKSLSTNNSFETLSQNTRLLDSIIHTAFEYAFEDLPILKERINEELKKEYRFKKNHCRKISKNTNSTGNKSRRLNRIRKTLNKGSCLNIIIVLMQI